MVRTLADKGFLVIYGITAVLWMQVTPVFIVGLFLSVAVSACGTFLRQRWALYLCTGSFCVAAVIWPKMTVFLPLLLYDILEQKLYVLAVPVAAGILRLGSSGAEMAVYLLMGAAASVLLEKRNAELKAREEKLRQIRDDSEEKNLLLKEKNKDLLEKQDYEIYTAILKERNRIAREIHDNVGHVLSRTILMTGALKAVNHDTSLSEPLVQLEHSLNQAMDSVRDSVHDIHDDSIDLKKVTESLISEFRFCPVHLEYDMELYVPKTVKYCFLSILKEALVNVSKHSNATEVHVLMREHPALYQLRIRDNGNGGNQKSGSGGIGLKNMEERVKNLHGNLQMDREKGFGIFITIPKEG